MQFNVAGIAVELAAQWPRLPDCEGPRFRHLPLHQRVVRGFTELMPLSVTILGMAPRTPVDPGAFSAPGQVPHEAASLDTSSEEADAAQEATDLPAFDLGPVAAEFIVDGIMGKDPQGTELRFSAAIFRKTQGDANLAAQALLLLKLGLERNLVPIAFLRSQIGQMIGQYEFMGCDDGIAHAHLAKFGYDQTTGEIAFLNVVQCATGASRQVQIGGVSLAETRMRASQTETDAAVDLFLRRLSVYDNGIKSPSTAHGSGLRQRDVRLLERQLAPATAEDQEFIDWVDRKSELAALDLELTGAEHSFAAMKTQILADIALNVGRNPGVFYQSLSVVDAVASGLYSTRASYPLKLALKSGNSELRMFYKPWTNAIERALSKLPDHAGRVFRSEELASSVFDREILEDLLDNPRPGVILQPLCYMSTSPNWAGAEGYLPNAPIKYEIQCMGGKEISRLSVNPAALTEVIFSEYTKFKVDSVSFDESNFAVVKMTQVAAPDY